MLRIAISQDIQILKDFENQLVNSGIDIDFHDNSKQLLFSRDFPAEIRYLNKNHLFFSLTNGMQDLAIVHEHFLTDQRKEYERIYSFDSTKTNLSVFVPSNMRYSIECFWLVTAMLLYAPNARGHACDRKLAM